MKRVRGLFNFMRNIQKLGLALFTLLLLLYAAGCAAAESSAPSQKLDFTLEEKSALSEDSGFSEATVVPDFSSGTDTQNSKPDSNRVNGSNIYEIDEPISQYGMYVDHVKIYKGKTLPEDVEMENFLYFDYGDQTDAEGRLLPETSYLFFDMDVRNDRDTEVTFTWNNMGVFLIDDENYLNSVLTVTAWETRYRSGKEYDDASKDYFVQTLAPGEEVTAKIGFIIDDEYIDDANLMFSPMNGFSADLYNKWKVYRINGEGTGS